MSNRHDVFSKKGRAMSLEVKQRGFMALTVWQPCASLLMIGAKPVEFRSWLPPEYVIGKRIAIHAADRRVRLEDLQDALDHSEDCCACGTPKQLDKARSLMRMALSNTSILPTAVVLGTAILGEPIKQDGWKNWGFPVSDLQPFAKPRPARGGPRFWYWEDAQ